MESQETVAAEPKVLASGKGENILHAVPEVSVTCLDSVKLEDLTKLVTGSVEANKVKRILARMKP
jgi:hypothetical protein